MPPRVCLPLKKLNPFSWIPLKIPILGKELSGAHQSIVYCHSDLQNGNIMIDEGTNSTTIIVSFLFCAGYLNFPLQNWNLGDKAMF